MSQVLARLRSISVIAIGISVAFAGENKLLESNLDKSLGGKSVVSNIIFGGKAIPAGYHADYPVITLCNTETGEISYRVEWLWMRMEIGTREMVRRFQPGSSFIVTDVNLKDDRLELKLKSGSGDLARLGLILGQGWQSHLDSTAVLGLIGRVLKLPSQQLVPSTASNNMNTIQTKTNQFLVSLPYCRRHPAPNIPGRISEADMQGILSGLDEERKDAYAPALTDAAKMRKALLAFNRAFRYQGAIGQGVVSVMDILGEGLEPKSPEDIALIIGTYHKCCRIAQLSQAHDERGNLLGPGAGDPEYESLLLNEATATSLYHAGKQDLENGATQDKALQGIKEELLGVEADFDLNDLKDARMKIEQLRTVESEPQVIKYFSAIQSLRNDLKAYLSLSEISEDSGIVPKISFLMAMRTYSGKSDLPITQQFIQERTPIVTKSILDSILGVPLISNVPIAARLTLVEQKASSETLLVSALNRLNSSLSKYDAILFQQKELVALNEAHLLAEAKELLSETEAKNLQNRSDQVSNLQKQRSLLNTEIWSLNEKINAIRVRAQTLKEEQTSLVGRIVNSAVVIVMLDEKFQITEVIGYKLEADKRRLELNILLSRDRTLLTRSVWNNVWSEYFRILPGLTVWQAKQTQSVLNGLEHKY